MSSTIDNNSVTTYSSAATVVNPSNYSLSSSSDDNSVIGKDAFLQIMIAKLANQDPLSPTDDTEFLSQLAQFTTLEQMINMTDTLTTQQGFDMVGKYVIAEYDGSYITGRVDSVIYDSGEIYLDVGGALVSMDKIKEVLAEAYKPETDTDETPDTDSNLGSDNNGTAADENTAVDTENGNVEE